MPDDPRALCLAMANASRMRSMQRKWVAAATLALLLAGCGGGATAPATVNAPKPTLETRVNVGALGFALDDFRSGAQVFFDKLNSCVQSGDSTSSVLCYRSARDAFLNHGAVVATSLDHLVAKAHGPCKTQLTAVAKRFFVAARSTISIANAIIRMDDVAASLDRLDRSLALVDNAFSRAQSLCGGG